jgi:NAD(P)-dependent dehydrogenase (short-subunit alcohol dehydrogenase family)
MRDSGGGAIVNITSISGLRASTLRTAYGTSKAGLAHLTQQQAVELAPLGMRSHIPRHARVANNIFIAEDGTERNDRNGRKPDCDTVRRFRQARLSSRLSTHFMPLHLRQLTPPSRLMRVGPCSKR